MTGANTHECICEFLRLAYDLVHELPPSNLKAKLTDRLIDCLDMGKRMQAKLIHYHNTYEPQKKKGVGLKPLPGAEERLRLRQERCQ